MANRSQAGLSDLELAAIQILVERELTAAVSEIRQARNMGLSDIKDRLKHIAGIDGLTVERGNAGTEIYHLAGQTIEVPAGNAGIRNRVQLLADGLKSPTPEALAKVDQAVAAIQQSDPKTEFNTEAKRMSITGLQSGAFQAKLAELKQRMAERQNQALAAIDAKVTEGSARLQEAADGAAAKIEKEISDALHEFAESTNGGPVL